MIQFSRLRINGFKSFVDKTELDIGPGLNGVVGPNGCGKSNLVEALRWVMGESSAKRMRGGGMEDVIFNGTEKRARRNIAEVSLLMDNTSRSAPAAYNNGDEIEIIRKIERDRGSNYKVNGKNARARDVQMLFADTVTGANSPALVSQGRVTEMINAKPVDRRLILEESAGISGLFARRHEAELRLKAADNNLSRMDDLLGSMEGRLNALKRQARQASRYKNLSAQIRQMEVLIAALEWEALEDKMRATRRNFEDAESIVAENMASVTRLTTIQTELYKDLPELRNAEARAAAALQAHKLNLQRLEDEAAHKLKALEDTKAQLVQTEADLSHAETEIKDNAETLGRIEEEQTSIINEQKNAEQKIEETAKSRDKLEQAVITLEARYNALMQSTAEAKAERDSIAKRIDNHQSRFDVLQNRYKQAKDELAALKEKAAQDDTPDYEAEIEALDAESAQNRKEVSSLNKQQDNISEEIEAARDHLSTQEGLKSKLLAEINILENFLDSKDEGKFPIILDEIIPESGFEKALSRALGDSLTASLDKDANAIWIERSEKDTKLATLPSECSALLPHVSAPNALKIALSQIGIVNSKTVGDSLIHKLNPGQSLVSKDGDYWRWDGYTIKAEAIDKHAQQLEQKNQLQSLNEQKPEIESAHSEAQNKLNTLTEKQNSNSIKIKEYNNLYKEVELKSKEKRQLWAKQREQLARENSHIERLEDTIKTSQADIREVEQNLRSDEAQLKAYQDNTANDDAGKLEALKEELSNQRSEHSELVRSHDLLQQQQNTRRARLHAIADERINLQNRSIRAKERLKELSTRKNHLSQKQAELSVSPQDFEDKKNDFLELITAHEKTRTEAGDKLAVREAEVSETNKALKHAERELGSAREKRASAQATMSAFMEQRDQLSQAITEKFEMRPEALKQHAALNSEHEGVQINKLKEQKESLLRERDSIGAVNLRAEDEVKELEEEVGTILHERNDLIQAIEELRGGIQKINVEARERLLRAFDQVNAHFTRLFVQLFGGGKAHLALIDAEDPLQSGLEIFAQPPGKTLQSLSLLSGGEQTMASIALIFAMFLTNPSPICVLDEIDAPLDDANVDRVCDLLDEIAERGETRFLVITHHRLTMARMDRLYGVTMAEKGISQLVSVDLQQSFEFVEAA